jgi:hypothetical protein
MGVVKASDHSSEYIYEQRSGALSMLVTRFWLDGNLLPCQIRHGSLLHMASTSERSQ